jgi:hypothetical protein
LTQVPWLLFFLYILYRDAKTRELLKVFGIDGQVDLARPEARVMPEQFIEEEIKVKPTKGRGCKVLSHFLEI